MLTCNNTAWYITEVAGNAVVYTEMTSMYRLMKKLTQVIKRLWSQSNTTTILGFLWDRITDPYFMLCSCILVAFAACISISLGPQYLTLTAALVFLCFI